jgi:hypothetical protein
VNSDWIATRAVYALRDNEIIKCSRRGFAARAIFAIIYDLVTDERKGA